MDTSGIEQTSRSPFGDEYTYVVDEGAESKRIAAFAAHAVSAGRRVVAVQGLGFVGAGMAAALSEARRDDGTPRFAVIGVDLASPEHYWKIARTQQARPPISSDDARIEVAYARAGAAGNLTATFSAAAYAVADVVVIDVNLDITKSPNDPRRYSFSYDQYLRAIETVAGSVREGTLVIVETTVPPGTMERVILPAFARIFQARGLDVRTLHLVHSYERVMPGARYLESITAFYRVFAGIDAESSRAARAFFDSFINTRDFPLSELPSPTASELAKVLENSFRAANIAFIQEWTEFAEAAGVDLFGVIDAIRVRPTHRNIMAPGFGVGGYCLPKDPLLADWALQAHFGAPRHLDMSLEAVRVNERMPLHTMRALRSIAGDLRGRRVALMGVSYLDGVADTRSSPAAVFYDRCVEEGATVTPHDPLVSFWPEKGLSVQQDFASFRNSVHDTAVFAVRHPLYLRLTASDIVREIAGLTCVVDANNVITDTVARDLARSGVRVAGVGKGHWSTWAL